MNWLGDSKPNFPAQISEILYAQFYATDAEGTVLGIFVLCGDLQLGALNRLGRDRQARDGGLTCDVS
jgi:hypothetical protein